MKALVGLLAACVVFFASARSASGQVVFSFGSGYCAPSYYPWYGGYYGYPGYAYYSYYGYGWRGYYRPRHGRRCAHALERFAFEESCRLELVAGNGNSYANGLFGVITVGP